MPEADLSMTQQAMGQIGSNQQQPRANVYAQFFVHPKLDPIASKKEGRQIYRDVDYIRILTPGSRDVISRPARASDVQTFAQQYQSFKAGQEQAEEGTPLEMWAGVSRAQCEELKYFKIQTVEQLAELNDGITLQHMGFVDLKNKAKLYIQAAKDAAPLAELQEELKARDEQIKLLQSQMADLLAKLEEDEDG
jgi:hypothetical protein